MKTYTAKISSEALDKHVVVIEIDGSPGQYVKAEVAKRLLQALNHVKTSWTFGGKPFTGTEKRMVEAAIKFAENN